MGRAVVGGKKLREGKGGNTDEEYEVAERKEQVESRVGLPSLERLGEGK